MGARTQRPSMATWGARGAVLLTTSTPRTSRVSKSSKVPRRPSSTEPGIGGGDPDHHQEGALSDLESNRKLNPNLDDCFPVQGWRKFEDVRDLECGFVQLDVS